MKVKDVLPGECFVLAKLFDKRVVSGDTHGAYECVEKHSGMYSNQAPCAAASSPKAVWIEAEWARFAHSEDEAYLVEHWSTHPIPTRLGFYMLKAKAPDIRRGDIVLFGGDTSELFRVGENPLAGPWVIDVRGREHIVNATIPEHIRRYYSVTGAAYGNRVRDPRVSAPYTISAPIPITLPVTDRDRAYAEQYGMDQRADGQPGRHLRGGRLSFTAEDRVELGESWSRVLREKVRASEDKRRRDAMVYVQPEFEDYE